MRGKRRAIDIRSGWLSVCLSGVGPKRLPLFGFALLLSHTCCAAGSQGAALIPRGAVLVFYGDSITARGDDDGGWIRWLRHKFSRELGRPDVRLINAGRGGAVANDLLSMLQLEFPRRPFIAVVGIGINDALIAGESPGAAEVAHFQITMQQIIGRLTRASVHVLVWSPLVSGEKDRGSNTNDAVIDAYGSAAERAARSESANFVDARSAFFDYRASEALRAGGSPELTLDGLHLSARGNAFLAELIYSGLVDLARDSSTSSGMR